MPSSCGNVWGDGNVRFKIFIFSENGSFILPRYVYFLVCQTIWNQVTKVYSYSKYIIGMRHLLEQKKSAVGKLAATQS
jgi:hypothetical protein